MICVIIDMDRSKSVTQEMTSHYTQQNADVCVIASREFRRIDCDQTVRRSSELLFSRPLSSLSILMASVGLRSNTVIL